MHENHLSSSSFLQSNYTRDMDPKERPNSLPKYRKNGANGMRLEINESKLALHLPNLYAPQLFRGEAFGCSISFARSNWTC